MKNSNAVKVSGIWLRINIFDATQDELWALKDLIWSCRVVRASSGLYCEPFVFEFRFTETGN